MMERILHHVSAAFLLLTLLSGLLMYAYWDRVMEPRLRIEALSQAELLAHAQARPVADALSEVVVRGPGMRRGEGLVDALDEALAFADPVSGEPFIERVTLALDYGVVPGEPGSLDLQRGERCPDCLLVEVALFEELGFELLGIARFSVSNRLYRALRDDMAHNLAGQYFIGAALLIALWGVIFLLIRRLQRERLRAERALHEAKEAAESANRAKSDFLANVSHEIRTPLNAVIGLTGLALKGESNAKQRDYLEKIESAGSSLLAVINDLLDLSKIDAGGMRLERLDFSLDQLFERIEGVVGEEVKRRGLMLRFTRDPDLPEWFKGDPLRLGQVLINLANNAVKFTEQGEVAIEVERIDAGGCPGEGEGVGERRLRFSVRDTGIGIDPARLPDLFRPFSQADGSTTRLYGGTGLGLSICKRLVEMMGGDIDVESAPGVGSRFHFTVSLRGGAAPESGVEGALPGALTAAAGGAPGEPPAILAVDRERPLLLVEDNLINQQIALELLGGMGLTVALAENGEEALERLRAAPSTNPFGLVLMDVQMPVMDGFEATRRLREDETLRGLPVVAMTAHAMSGDEERCLNVGMDDYLSKPVTEARLLEVLRRWMPATLETPSATPAVSEPTSGSNPGGATPLEPELERELALVRRGPTVGGEGDPTLPRFNGIDTVRALEIASGNRRLLGRVLRQFLAANHDTAERVAEGLAAGRLDEAKARVHTLKGEAANIAAREVAEAALAVEYALREAHDWRAPLERLSGHLAGLLDGIADWVERSVPETESESAPRPESETEAAAGPPPSADSVTGGVDARSAALLAQLADYLAENNTRAHRCFNELRHRLRGGRAVSEALAEIEQALEGLEFEVAGEVLARLTDSLGDSLGGPRPPGEGGAGDE